jgi:hypothetical protein
MADNPSTRGNYLCTGYHLYITREPCIMYPSHILRQLRPRRAHPFWPGVQWRSCIPGLPKYFTGHPTWPWADSAGERSCTPTHRSTTTSRPTPGHSKRNAANSRRVRRQSAEPLERTIKIAAPPSLNICIWWLWRLQPPQVLVALPVCHERTFLACFGEFVRTKARFRGIGAGKQDGRASWREELTTRAVRAVEHRRTPAAAAFLLALLLGPQPQRDDHTREREFPA